MAIAVLKGTPVIYGFRIYTNASFFESLEEKCEASRLEIIIDSVENIRERVWDAREQQTISDAESFLSGRKSKRRGLSYIPSIDGPSKQV